MLMHAMDALFALRHPIISNTGFEARPVAHAQLPKVGPMFSLFPSVRARRLVMATSTAANFV